MNIYRKLLAAKKEMPYLKKDKKGFNYSYVTPSQVFATVNPILNKLGLLLVTNVIKSESAPIQIITKNGPKTEWKYDLDFVFDWVDTEDGEKISIPWKASGVNGEDKGLGSALTYAERYFILKQFNIPTDDDDPDNFQAKFMSEDDRKELAENQKAEKEKSDAANLKLQKEEAENRTRQLNAVIAKLAKCYTVDDLKLLKKSLQPWMLTTTEFNTAATKRFTEISKPELQPAH